MAAVLRRHHIDKAPFTQLCEEDDPQPSLLRYWQNQPCESAAAARRPPAAAAPSKALEAKFKALEKQVAKQDPVIAWVTEEQGWSKNALVEC